MQRLTGVVVNDASLMASFAKLYADTVDVSDAGARGTWGLGFHGNGEMLVKKAPLGGAIGPAAVLAGVRARHVVLAANGDPAPRRTVEDAQPLRYRDCGGAGLGAAGIRQEAKD